MEMNDTQRIAAPRETVYAALNDPEILKQCIPGCEELEMVSPTEMNATVTLRIGPVKARFKGSVELSDLVPPESYTISGEGKGGVAGFAKGGARVKLIEEGDETLLQYDVKADIGGKLAQLGSRLIDSTRKNWRASSSKISVRCWRNGSGFRDLGICSRADKPRPA